MMLVCSRAPAEAAVRVGVEAGLNHARLTYDNPDPFLQLETEFHPCWSAGLRATIDVRGPIAVGTGLRYVEYGDVQTFEILGSFQAHWTLQYLAIPLQLEVRPFPSRRLSVAAGPEFGWLAKAPIRIKGTFPTVYDPDPDPGSGVTEEFTFDETGAYRRWNISLAGGVGWEFPAGRHAAAVRARYVHGLRNVLPTSVRRTTRGIELTLGLDW